MSLSFSVTAADIKSVKLTSESQLVLIKFTRFRATCRKTKCPVSTDYHVFDVQ